MNGTGRKIHSSFAVVILCAAPIATTAAQTTASAARRPGDVSSRDVSRASGVRIHLPGVPNFGQVTPSLYRGAQPSQKGFENLAKMGVAIVIDLRDGNQGKAEEKEVSALGMKFIGIPWRCRDPKDDDFARFVTVLRDNPDKKIFVHCHSGVDRTGMMIASYRMTVLGWTPAEAWREMQAFGFTMFHQIVCTGLGSYEQRFPTVVSSSPAFRTLRLAEQKSVPAIPPKPNFPLP